MLHADTLKSKPRPDSDAIGIYRLSPKVFCFLVVLDILEVEDGVVIDEFVGSILSGLMETAMPSACGSIRRTSPPTAEEWEDSYDTLPRLQRRHPDPPQTMSEYFQYLKYFIYLYRNNATVCTCIKEITGGNSTSTKKP